MKEGFVYLKEVNKKKIKVLVMDDEVEVELPKGMIKEDINTKKTAVLFKSKLENGKLKITEIEFKDNAKQKENNKIQNQESARAPYNFVPLNDNVIESNNSDSKFDRFVTEQYSGYIDLTITALTPLFIGSSKKGEFFKIHDKYAIPGSSIRGVIRSLCEILGFGKFVNFKDRYLYHRPDRASTNVRMGFLYYNNENDQSKYKIFQATENPTNNIGRSNENVNEFKYETLMIDKNLFIKIYSGKMGAKNFQIKYEKNNMSYPIEDDLLNSYLLDDTKESKGEMANLLTETKRKDNVIRKYCESQKLQLEYFGIPVWYETDTKDNKTIVKSFGHCKNYRAAYSKSIGDHSHIPKEIQNPNLTDFVEGIFGKDKGISSGKVYFEDAVCNAQVNSEEAILQILANPKPTCYPHYLEQPVTYPRDKKDWNKNAKIRGYKLYWHRDTDKTTSTHKNLNWRKTIFREEDINKFESDITNKNIFGDVADTNRQMKNTYEEFEQKFKDNWTKKINNHDKIQFSVVNVVPKGTIFCNGRIRFDNLTKEELGLLLTAIDLDTNCCHKMGMGKPLGLGSIKIIGELKLIDRKTRYTTLFDDTGKWDLPLLKDSRDFKADFFSHLNMPNAAKTIWNEPRIAELKKMLEFDENKVGMDIWLNKTRYMDLGPNEFGAKRKLLEPSEIKLD